MHAPILRFTRFDPEMEDRFQADLTARVIPLGRLGAALGAILLIALAAWDLHLDQGSLPRTVPIRLVIAAVFVAAFVFTFTPAGKKSVSPYMALQVMLGAAYPALLSQLPGGFVAGVPGMLLPMSVVPIFSTKLWHAALALAALVALPNAVMAAADATSFEIVQANYWLVSGAGVAAGLTYLMHLDRRRAFSAQEALDAERIRSESLLRNVLPAEIVERLKDANESTSESFEHATVIFADIAGFTDFGESVDAEQLVAFLNELFGVFDDIVADAGIEKIKTIGDSYMAVAGVPVPRPDHAAAAVAVGVAMVDTFDVICRTHDLRLGLRVGVHSGRLVGGVIGKRKFAYDVWGDTVNVASRMESSGLPGRVQISETTRALLPPSTHIEERGPVSLKNHSPIEAYLVS